jgi:hypothetical protein
VLFNISHLDKLKKTLCSIQIEHAGNSPSPQEGFNMSDDRVKAHMMQVCANIIQGCIPIANALERGLKRARSEEERKSVNKWIVSLRDAEKDNSILCPVKGHDQFAIRIPLAQALDGASKFLYASNPDLKEMICPLLKLTLFFTSHMRLQVRASYNYTNHDKEAGILLHKIHGMMKSNERLAKVKSEHLICSWLASSHDQYDQALSRLIHSGGMF